MLKPAITLLATLFAATAFAGGVGLGGIGGSRGGGAPVGGGNGMECTNPDTGERQVRTRISQISQCTWPDVTDPCYVGEVKPINCPGGDRPEDLDRERRRFNGRFEWCIKNTPNDGCPRQAIGF